MPTYAEARKAHEKDINTIFEALRDESESRGWCEEYGDFVDDLLGKLTVQPTVGIRKDWEFDVSGMIVKVSAFSESEARDKLHQFISDNSFGGVLETD
jgi:hypothetical protein